MPIWTYLPKTKTYRFRPVSRYHDFGNLEIRRIKRRDYWNLFYTMWLFIFLTFAMKIGTALVFPFQERGSYLAAIFSKGIQLPYGQEAKKVGMSRHIIHISYDKDLILRYEGMRCDLDDIHNLILNSIDADPQLIIILIIDKRIQMKNVNELLSEIRKVGWVRLNFMTRKHKHSNY